MRSRNQIRIKIVNRTEEPREYAFELVDADDLKLVSAQNPLPLDPDEMNTATVFVQASPEAFSAGVREINFRISDGVEFTTEVPYRLLGPQ